jgi:hypothetical protein
MTAPLRNRELHYFLLLNEDERRAAIQRLADSGVGDHGIAAATRYSVEQIRKILGERRA